MWSVQVIGFCVVVEMDGTLTASAVRLPRDSGLVGGRALLGDRVTSSPDDEDDVDENRALLGVLSQVQSAYRHLLRTNNCFYTNHGMGITN